MSTSFGIIRVAHAPVRSVADDTSEMVTQLLFGETLRILEQKGQWMLIQCYNDDYEGWMDSKQLLKQDLDGIVHWQKKASYRIIEHNLTLHSEFGDFVIYKGSLVPEDYERGFKLGEFAFHAKKNSHTLSRNFSIIEIAQSYLNTPYLWGGRSITGIDCSGFTQQVFAFIGKDLPRNASQQIELGVEVSFNNSQAGDLAFFSNATGKIVHVGILTGLGTILHAHGRVTEDWIKSEGIFKKNDMTKSHDLHSIKRI